jgi:hypothetical protein
MLERLAGVDNARRALAKYFRSIYFREPGGVLFEIATEIPGFTIDEPAADGASRLAMPSHNRRDLRGGRGVTRVPCTVTAASLPVYWSGPPT